MFLISCILLFCSSYLITSVVHNKEKNNLGFLYFLLIAFSQIIISFELLSLIKQIKPFPFLICNAAVFAASLAIFIKAKKTLYKPQIIPELKKIINAVKRDKFLVFASFCFIVFILSKLFVIFVLPVTFGDALSYYFPRCTSWLQYGSIAHFITPDTREVIMPVNMEFLYTWILMFLKNETGAGIFSFISFIGCLFAIYNLTGESGFCRRKRIWALFVFSSFTIIGTMASTPCADLFIGSLLLSGIYLFYVFLKYETKTPLYFSTLAFALALGTKTTAIIAFPSVLIILSILTYTRRKESFLKYSALFTGLFIINFIIFSSYNYILNFIDFNNPVSCPEQFLLNKFRGGFKGYLCNLIKYSFSIFDASGINTLEFYNNFINNLQTRTLALIGETPLSYSSPYFPGVFIYNANINTSACVLGVLGFLCFLPSLIYIIYKGITKYKSRKILLPFLLACSLIFNILIFSRVMLFTSFNMRYLVTFYTLASPIVIFSYIKSGKNLYKWVVVWLMFVYMFFIPHQKPVSYLFNMKKITASNQNTKIITREETLIQKYFLDKNPVKIANISHEKWYALIDIEKLKLHGYTIDKLLAENIEEYDITKYDYIIANPYKIASSNIKRTQARHCTYLDYNMKTVTAENNQKPATVECFIPFDYFHKNGFKEVNDIKLINFVILKKD